MRKITELLGLPVVVPATGETIGMVEDVLLDLKKRAIAAIVLAKAGWFHDRKGIELGDISRLGPDAVMVKEGYCLKTGRELGEEGENYSVAAVTGKHILTVGGKNLGTVADIFVDENGTLTGYQISDSILEDLLDGRGFMPMAGCQVIGETTVIVPDRDSVAGNGDICEV